MRRLLIIWVISIIQSYLVLSTALTLPSQKIKHFRFHYNPTNHWSRLYANNTPSMNNDIQYENLSLSNSFDAIADSRYACTRFLRNPETNLNNFQNSATSTTNQEIENDSKTSATTLACTNDSTKLGEKNIQASTSTRFEGTTPNSEVLEKAIEALTISLRSPSGFNAQPYHAIIVSDSETKSKMAKYCLGRNADRVRDSDCTIVFLADCQCTRNFPKLKSLLQQSNKNKKRKPLTNFALRKIQILIGLFSSGYPLPRILSNPISFLIRTSIAMVGILTRHRILLPSLSSSETWATKNTMLFAMTYMLSCASKNIATCPMEGYQASGIKKVLCVPHGGRYKIPLIVSTGLPYVNANGANLQKSSNNSDDAGMTHGPTTEKQGRFALEDVVFTNGFGNRVTHTKEIQINV